MKRALSWMLILVLCLFPSAGRASGEALGDQAAYEAAAERFAAGDYDEALSLFMGLDGYMDSALYAIYIEGVLALDQGDITQARICFEVLSSRGFLDSADINDYCRARVLESESRLSDAVELYAGLNVRDSVMRELDLRRKLAEATPAPAPTPAPTFAPTFAPAPAPTSAPTFAPARYQASGFFWRALKGGGVEITGYVGAIKELTIPDTIEGLPVTSIGEEAFYGCESLTSVSIPLGVNSIESSAFKYCYNLASFTIPNGVVSIGFEAFYGCVSLTTAAIPNGVTNIGGGAFRCCPSLASVSIPESVTEIGSDAFAKSGRIIDLANKKITGKKEVPLVVYCTKGSYAQQYCQKENIDFITDV